MGYYTLWVRAVHVVNRTHETKPVRCIWRSYKKEDRKKEAGNLPSRFHHLQLLLQTWSMGIKWGRGGKRLNEQSERYLQLPPLTWATTVVIGRHPYKLVPLCVSFWLSSSALFSVQRKTKSEEGKIVSLDMKWKKKKKTRDGESTGRKHRRLGKRWKKKMEEVLCTLTA